MNILEQVKEFYKLLGQRHMCIFIRTKYTQHYIERILHTCHDRGAFRWFAEMTNEYHQDVAEIEAARVCHIDGADMFPRYYFMVESVVNEFMCWIEKRGQTILEIYPQEV